MNSAFLQGSLEIANLFIALFVLGYAYHFIKKSHRHRDRLPWELLIIATVFFALFEVFGLLSLLSKGDYGNVRYLLHTLFAGFLLFSFAYQHHLIHHQKCIRIHNKHKVKKNEIK